MILSDTAIVHAIRNGSIVIQPFDDTALGGNSYDVHLSQYGATYGSAVHLDAKREHELTHFTVEESGTILRPGVLYLASTVEYTETHEHVPYLDGKSSIGRLGIAIHATAGRGDVGFCGHWTLEISVVQPVIVYPNMPIGQLTFHTVEGAVSRPYASKAGAKYTDARNPRPVGSRMYKNF